MPDTDVARGRLVAAPVHDPVIVAAGCGELVELAAAARRCVACPELAAARTHVVVGDTPAGARLAVVGEAPGATEDAEGRPFVGRAGRVLDALLAEAGLDRTEVAVLNAAKCRPPGNRTPTRAELERCRPWLERQLTLARPELVVALGLTATTWFLGRRITLAGVRGRVHEVGVAALAAVPAAVRAGAATSAPAGAGLRADVRRVLPTYHPSAAVRFGPNGAPMAALRADLALAATLLAGEPAAEVTG